MGDLYGAVPSDWRPSNKYPTLAKAKLLAIDCETYDPELMENGPGGVRGKGHLVGFSIATDDGEFKGYYPLRHQGGDNVTNPDKALLWLRDQLKRPSQPKVGANIIYDREWLRVNDVEMAGHTYDVQIAEGLLDENRMTYRLDSLAEDYLGEHKEETLMARAAQQFLGLNADPKKPFLFAKKVKANLWRLPARYVGLYGEGDADLPLRIFKLQEPKLRDEGLWDLFVMETELVDLLLEMRFKGIPVNVELAEQVADELASRHAKVTKRLSRLCGFTPNIWANEDLVKVCEKLNYEYTTTTAGRPSFTADWMEEQQQEVFQLIVKARRLDRGGSVYLRSKVLDLQVNGRVYPQFWPVRTEAQGAKHGTNSGRFASSNPNAQQIPARDPELAPLIRSVFVPEKGCEWTSSDYSQQEFRVTVHYAYKTGCRGGEEARQRYHDAPDTDYHQMVAEMADIPRKDAKTLNLALSYGMGVKTLSKRLHIPYEQAEALFKQYHGGVPFVKQLAEKCKRVAKHRGYVKTLLGRRQRFVLYGPPKWSPEIRPLRYDDALKKFGAPVQLYFLHKAPNRVVQGSAADMIKAAMHQLYKLGYVPHITAHDELCHSTNTDKQRREVREVMLHCLPLEVPLKVDVKSGPSWGEAEPWNG